MENYWDLYESKAKFEEESSFVAPESVANQAKKAIDYKDKYKDEVKGGTQVGWVRANQLANRKSISLDTIKRMVSFFARHEGNDKISPEHKDEPWKDNGYIAWLLWGGDAGKSWANKILKQNELKVK